MKKVFVVFFLSACTVQTNTETNRLLVTYKPTTASKETLRMVMGCLYYDIVAPENVIVLKQSMYTKVGWREAIVIYYQPTMGTFWEILEVFPQEDNHPQIQKVEQPKPDSLVVWVTPCKDLTVTRSYLLQHNVWTPQ